MKIPTELKHKPVVISEDYNKIDGRYSEETDTKGLSLGLAQWNDRGRVDISAKIWRHTGEKWSRQSEELPLHRVLDLAILICRTKIYFSNVHQNGGPDFDPDKKIDRIGLQGGAMNVALCSDNEKIKQDFNLFDECLHKDDEILGERLQILSSLLKEMEI